MDATGRVHVLLSHMPDAQGNDTNFNSARTKSQVFPLLERQRRNLGSFSPGLAISSSNNVYAILPDLRIAGASVASDFTDWSVLTSVDNGRFFSDPLIDAGASSRKTDSASSIHRGAHRTSTCWTTHSGEALRRY